jgi:hypothetical protein
MRRNSHEQSTPLNRGNPHLDGDRAPIALSTVLDMDDTTNGYFILIFFLSFSLPIRKKNKTPRSERLGVNVNMKGIQVTTAVREAGAMQFGVRGFICALDPTVRVSSACSHGEAGELKRFKEKLA